MIPDVRHEVVDQLEERVVRPVQVLEHEKERLAVRTGARAAAATANSRWIGSSGGSSSPRPSNSERYRVASATSGPREHRPGERSRACHERRPRVRPRRSRRRFGPSPPRRGTGSVPRTAGSCPRARGRPSNGRPRRPRARAATSRSPRARAPSRGAGAPRRRPGPTPTRRETARGRGRRAASPDVGRAGCRGPRRTSHARRVRACPSPRSAPSPRTRTRDGSARRSGCPRSAPPGRRRVLQPRRGVHDVTGRERLLGRGVDRDERLAGRDARADLESEPGVPLVQRRGSRPGSRATRAPRVRRRRSVRAAPRTPPSRRRRCTSRRVPP